MSVFIPNGHALTGGIPMHSAILANGNSRPGDGAVGVSKSLALKNSENILQGEAFFRCLRCEFVNSVDHRILNVPDLVLANLIRGNRNREGNRGRK